MQIKLKNSEIQEYVNAPAGEFPKYTTQLRYINPLFRQTIMAYNPANPLIL